MKNKIMYTKPSIGELEIAYVTDAVTHGWGDKCYDYINKLERNFSEYLGVRYAIATSSCTGALHMGMAALGIGPGDEVILADTNWIASVVPVVHLGATPVFVDIDPDNWCISVQQAERAITSKTKAIIAVHLYGNLCDMDGLRQLARTYGLALIEDAAEALGSEYKGNKAGSMGTFSAFSFHGTKTMTTGEGGIFATNDEALYQKVLTLSNHGRKTGQNKQFWPDEIGFKYKMSNIQAALGCAQLERIEELITAKRKVFHRYAELMKGLPRIQLNPESHECVNSYWMPTVVFSEDSGIHQKQLQEAFLAENIDARVFFWPLSALPMFKENKSNTNAYSICQRAMNLPSFVDISMDEQKRVVAVLTELITKNIK
ncbi:Putative PLP-dependent enzyme possibly involved in cell wall biogenesis [Rheinheimera sp. A13L]|uniref:DegT/DnrJ/EryC1/StrS family aminotransferase n=1 Tax=Rheinheimera sp. A13L TaxID=506534 RepID=UPI00021255DF|nr:DegT/DnrJ/EryC1/StrS aminotransferase family protein [Rheinheimera sp. A13L]EGM78233.1 Putative PLP-dependent enzyme possibly involved in cell wall biogenesis [Rheinheimera sp. A13L]